MATRKRSSSTKKTPTARKGPISRKPIDEPVLDAAEEAAITDAASPPTETVVTVMPEAAFVSRMAPPPPPRPRPEQRRGIFFDVENTSRPQDIGSVLRHLMIDRVGIDTDFTAVGNWRVIGHETARILAQAGANLVHSAPSTGVRDWSDLRIAVGAGVWLAGARPGDMIDIVSDDQAFDAVGDVASSLGVVYHRLSYRSLTGHAVAEPADVHAGDGQGRRRSRGGRGRRGGRRSDGGHGDTRHQDHRQAPARPHVPVHVERPAAVQAGEDEVHTAPHDELIEVVREMMATSPGGVTLDQLANALREHGFRRTPGSPRLITRLKRIKELEMSRNGLIRLGAGAPLSHAPVAIEPDERDDASAPETEEQAASEPATGERRRRRRRRGGRGRRGRRGGGGGSGATNDVVAAAPSMSSEVPTAEF